jgi:plasmid stabilization system protein ParE
MLKAVSHPEADEELEEAALHYAAINPGLGRDFIDEFEATLSRIIATPQQWRFVQGENRRLNFHRFPYAIIYSLRGDTLFVKAVMHQRRRPFYWQHRQTP